MKKYLSTITALFLALVITESAQAITWEWTDSFFKTHTYITVSGSYTWNEANQEVTESGGGLFHLATITSWEEQLAMEEAMTGSLYGEWWLGGYQDIDATDFDTDWHWVTGEAWTDYINWASGEPNDWPVGDDESGQENYLGTWSRYDWKWNDEHGRANITGYIMELVTPIPEPATMMLFGIGLLGLAGVSRRKK